MEASNLPILSGLPHPTAMMPANDWDEHHAPNHKLPKTTTTTTTITQVTPEPPFVTKPDLPWRPFYLRRTVLGSFIPLFLVAIVVIEVLLAISNKNNGFSDAIPSQHYLWTFGPTALLTLVAAAWDRAEYQSKLVAPWLRLSGAHPTSDHSDAGQTVLLDYLSDFQPLTVFKSLRNRDFAVSITATVSIMIKILILISTGLVTLSFTAVRDDSYPLFAQDIFVPDRALSYVESSTQWFMMTGMVKQNFTFPDGLSKDYAFQSVAAPGLPSTAEIRYTVDALESSLECVPADLAFMSPVPGSASSSWDPMNVTITSPGCDVKLAQLEGPWAQGCKSRESCLVARFSSPFQCDGTTGEAGRRLLVMFANLTYSEDETGDLNGIPVDHDAAFSVGGGTNNGNTNSSSSSTGGPSPDLEEVSGDVSEISPAVMPAGLKGRQDSEEGYILLGGIPFVYGDLFVVHKSVQMLCVPTFAIGKVEIVRNGTEILKTSPSVGATNTPKTLDTVSGWDIMTTNQKSVQEALRQSLLNNNDERPSFSGIQYSTDGLMSLALITQLRPGDLITSLFNPDRLEEVVQSVYKQSTAIITKQALMKPASIETHGSVVSFRNRLVVRTWAAQWMAGILAASTAFVLLALFAVPARGVLPCSPSTIPGISSIILKSPDLICRLQSLGEADRKTVEHVLQNATFKSGATQSQQLSHDHFVILDTHNHGLGSARISPQPGPTPSHPLVMHPATRTSLCAILLGLIIALELMLRKSTNGHGFGIVDDDTYIHYTWTSLPALVLGALAMLVSAMDFQIRVLAPYLALKRPRGVATKIFTTIEFSDMSIPRAIYNEARLGDIGALATTMALLVASLFTVFSASLFHTVPQPSTGSMALRLDQSFTSLYPSSDFWYSQARTASLILKANLTYPRFTHGDLAFPKLVSLDISMPVGTRNFSESAMTIEATVPAFRGRLQCRPYESSAFRPNLTRGGVYSEVATSISVENVLGINIAEEDCRSQSDTEQDDLGGLIDRDFWVETNPDTKYFGFVNQRFGGGEPFHSLASGNNLCSDVVYVWGEMDYDVDPAVQHIAGMGCNFTAEAVDVNVTFLGTNLDIDHQHPPQPLENTIRPLANPNPFSIPVPYQELAETDVGGDVLDPFFGIVTSSSWAVPRWNLGDPAAADEIRESIRFHHGIIYAQLLNRMRSPANDSNATVSLPSFSQGPGLVDVQLNDKGDVNMTDAQWATKAVVTADSRHHRVVQDEASTRILQGLLGATLLLVVVGWVLIPQTAVLASSPTTIAARAALVAGGNLLELLPDDAQEQSKRWTRDQMEAALGGAGMRFRLGWGDVDVDMDERHGEPENEDLFVRRFGIFGESENGLEKARTWTWKLGRGSNGRGGSEEDVANSSSSWSRGPHR